LFVSQFETKEFKTLFFCISEREIEQEGTVIINQTLHGSKIIMKSQGERRNIKLNKSFTSITEQKSNLLWNEEEKNEMERAFVSIA
jgi:hypothetical protein